MFYKSGALLVEQVDGIHGNLIFFQFISFSDVKQQTVEGVIVMTISQQARQRKIPIQNFEAFRVLNFMRERREINDQDLLIFTLRLL